jgi:hypothetical protein
MTMDVTTYKITRCHARSSRARDAVAAGQAWRQIGVVVGGCQPRTSSAPAAGPG